MAKENNNPLCVVIDTNVLISFLWGSRRMVQIINALTEGRLIPAVSSLTLNELIQVASRKKFSRKFSKEIAGQFIETYADIALNVAPRKKVKISRDNKDDIFLECAIEAKADYLISGDKDLLSIGNYQGVNIVTPATFAKMVLE